MPGLSPKIQDCVDQLCSHGCGSVRELILQLEQGELPDGTAHLDATERQQVLRELKSIIAVYDMKLSDL
jgi:hypothetical protein